MCGFVHPADEAHLFSRDAQRAHQGPGVEKDRIVPLGQLPADDQRHVVVGPGDGGKGLYQSLHVLAHVVAGQVEDVAARSAGSESSGRS